MLPPATQEVLKNTHSKLQRSGYPLSRQQSSVQTAISHVQPVTCIIMYNKMQHHPTHTQTANCLQAGLVWPHTTSEMNFLSSCGTETYTCPEQTSLGCGNKRSVNPLCQTAFASTAQGSLGKCSRNLLLAAVQTAWACSGCACVSRPQSLG